MSSGRERFRVRLGGWSFGAAVLSVVVGGAALLGLIFSVDLRQAQADEERRPASEAASVLPDKVDVSNEAGHIVEDANCGAPSELTIIDGREVEPGDPSEHIAIDMRLQTWGTVYRQSVLDVWNAGGPPATFMQETTDRPSVDEAVFDVDVITPNSTDGDAPMYHVKMRVRQSDGMVGLIFVQQIGDAVPLAIASREGGQRAARGGRFAAEASTWSAASYTTLFPIGAPSVARASGHVPGRKSTSPVIRAGDAGAATSFATCPAEAAINLPFSADGGRN